MSAQVFPSDDPTGPHEPSLLSTEGLSESVNNFNAACARTLTRGLALYFSRPVRLFRPAKVTGWQFLKNAAQQQGSLLTPTYLVQLYKSQGVWVVPKHFLPPMALNAALGTVLWTSYGEAYSLFAPSVGYHSVATAALAGACAGGCQALLAAPAENLRLVLEGGSGTHASWACVWKEVFQSRIQPSNTTTKQQIQEIRELRGWLKDVGEMAGRGWEGWRWGCAKDICAFSAFFSVFEITRRASSRLKKESQELCSRSSLDSEKLKNVPKVVNALSLIGGGVLAGLLYEAVSQPFDRIRRIIYIHRLDNPKNPASILTVLTASVREEGFMTLLRDPLDHTLPAPQASSIPSWITNLGRTLARVGPWGVGFLVWEAYGPGLG